MAYRKKTLRIMSPTARKVARLAGELESVAIRLKNTLPELQQLDSDSEALKTARVRDIEEVKRRLRMISGLVIIKYTEIHNVQAINHILEVVRDHAEQALATLA